jgi:cardiolipin synthase
MNHRDHRKITIIDGRIGYTGGYNLADEYFHLTEPYGYWKDSGVRLEGGAVASMTALFLEMWNAIRSHDEDDSEFSRYFPPTDFPKAQGYVLAYGESPLDALNTAEDVFINLLAGAQRYAWFTTPYLILTDEMTRALVLAAGRGVDVRIITPSIPDKKLTFRVTRSYYRELVAGGVRIYEYTPGFIHAKQCVSDDLIAICGTINLDYRSLYHHFENGVLMLNTPAVTEIREDFTQLFSQSHEVTARYRSRTSFPFRLRDALLHLIAPLL